MRRIAIAAVVLLCGAIRAHAQVPTFVLPAGVTIPVTTVGPTTVTSTLTSITFSWGAAPTPTPGPVVPPVPPAPTPAPVVVPTITENAWAMVIYGDPARLTDAQKAMLDSKTLEPAARSSGVIVEKHPSSDGVAQTWIGEPTPGHKGPLNGAALPLVAILIADAEGHAKLVHSQALPASEADMIALFKKLRGGN